jgi:hypothetical protein
VADDLHPIFDELYQQGFKVDQTTQGHYSVKSPNGLGIVHLAQSNDNRAYQNILRDLKRIGFVWPPPPRSKNSKASSGNGVSSKAEACCTKCFSTNGSCKDSRCVCHQPHVPPKPKDSDALYRDLSEAKIALQLADEVLVAKEKILSAALGERDEAGRMRKDALSSFVASKRLFDEHMCKDVMLEAPSTSEKPNA